jgi:hypothetical protein
VCKTIRGGTQLKQVIDEACNNAKRYKTTTTPTPIPTQNIDEVEQHGGAHKPCYARPPQNGVAKQP